MVDIIVYCDRDIIHFLKQGIPMDNKELLQKLQRNCTQRKISSFQEPYEISIIYPTEHSKHYVQVALNRMGIK